MTFQAVTKEVEEKLTASNTDMLQLLCDIQSELQSNRSLRLSLPIPLASRIIEAVANYR